MLIGIVGRTNTGKSTFFKAATLAEVEIANRPFVTLKANHGIGFVKVECAEKGFNVKCQPKAGYCKNNCRFVPVELLDVPGLIKDAHKGAGLGLSFLDELRQADAFIEIIDISGSTNEKGENVDAGSYDPAEDIRVLETEIDMWFYSILKKPWERFTKQLKQEGKDIEKEIIKQFSGLRITEAMVKETLREVNLSKEGHLWSDEDLKKFATTLRKKSKPMIIAANKIDLPRAEGNYKRLKEEFGHYIIVPCSAESELALKEAAKHNLIEYASGEKDFKLLEEGRLNEKQKAALRFVKENILMRYGSTGVQDVLNKAVFELLKYIAVYPVANSKLTDSENRVLPDCFLVPEKTTALDFAFKVHTDIGKSFIRAIDLRTKQVVGKEHLLKNLDVLEIVTSK